MARALRYLKPCDLKIERKLVRGKFTYVGPQNRPITDTKTLQRIAKMALPPAWTDVRICATANGHLQAVGRDVRGRMQYRYHEEYRKQRDQNKFHRLMDFVQALPRIRKRLRADLAKREFSREKVLAAVVDIMQRTNMRVGNDIYSRTNHSYGITTIRNSHAKVRGKKVAFDYRAKSGKIRHVEFTDPVLSRIVRRCQELPGQELFCYLDEQGKVHDVTSTAVNKYIAEISGQHFTAKDFRTWCGTLRAYELALNLGAVQGLNERAWRSRHLNIIRETAAHLGNTPSICEKYYIHPQIFHADRSGIHRKGKVRKLPELTPVECAAFTLLAA